MHAIKVSDWFIKSWSNLNSLDKSIILQLKKPLPGVERGKLNEAFEDKYITEQALISTINNYCEDEDLKKSREKILYVMRAIDMAFSKIHNRSIQDKGLPEWLATYKAGEDFPRFGSCDGLYLIPNGPLLRESRDQYASGGELFSENFHSLRVVNSIYTHTHGSTTIKHIHIQNSSHLGIFTKPDYKVSTIGFFPVMTSKNDIKTDVVQDGENCYVKFSGTNNISKNLELAFSKNPKCDIGIAPEFSIAEIELQNLLDSYRNFENAPELFVAGTGDTTSIEPQTKWPWNEARVLNSSGAILWTHRKIWPATLSNNVHDSYGIDTTSSEAHEANANGSSLTIADIEGFGRCLILICQDIELDSLVSSVLTDFQPDWVFVPILDSGKFHGRWAYQSATNKSKHSQARFLIANSGAYQSLVNSEFECGMCIGPRGVPKGSTEKGRQRAEILTSEDLKAGTINWEADGSSDARWKNVVF